MTGRVLYLIRHGRSDFDWTGDAFASPRGDHWNPPLSEEGRRQAALLAERLLVMDLEPFVAYSSPLRRASETAAAFAERAGIEVTFEDDLMEAHIGGWEGVPFEEIIEADPEILHHLRHQQPIWRRGPGPRWRTASGHASATRSSGCSNVILMSTSCASFTAA